MLAHAFQAKFLLLYGFIFSAVFVHFRGRVRHCFTRQLTDHSTILAPPNALLPIAAVKYALIGGLFYWILVS